MSWEINLSEACDVLSIRQNVMDRGSV